ncbi:hypothetical protein N7526_011449 [Penicillium atrosanguineum]|nr:hypothetical protein N7526_011449 [Penicillium atrosanguineum]
MSGPSGGEISQQQLDLSELKATKEIRDWMLTHPYAEWKQSPRLRLVEQCSDTALRTTLEQLTENFSVVYFRTMHSGFSLKEGELILVSPDEGCAVKDGDRSYHLKYGTKACFTKKISVQVSEGTTVHLIWKVKKSSI